MTPSGALLDMPPKKKGVGRPKAPKPVRSLASVKGTEEFEAWFDKVVQATRLRTRTLVLLQGLERMAKEAGITDPMPER